MGSIGWRPDRNPDRSAAGPYLHGSVNSDANNANVQVGLGMLQGENGGVLSANAQAGMWGNDKNWRVGARADAQMARGQAFSQDWGVGVDGGVFDADAEASFGNDGMTVGAGANIMHGAVTMGGFNREDSWADSQLRLGASLGVGYGGRAHWADSDGDGVREIGLGVDFGPFSGDFKTEALGHAWNWLTS
jgi:hypothetical protein